MRKFLLQGLHQDYKTKVKIQNPKTLEDTIKSAQIYDDNVDGKPSHGFTKSTSHSTHSVLNTNSKHKMGSSSREIVQKKPKGVGDPFSNNKLARVCREKLCFQCFGLHEHKDFPQLKGKVSS